MKIILQSLIVLLAALVPVSVCATYVKIADGVYQDGTTLYISSSVTTLGPLQVNPSVIYSFAATPPACVETTFTGYGAMLHMPSTSYGVYFIDSYWGNFINMFNDAVEPMAVTINGSADAELLVGNMLNLTATVAPNNASLHSVQWTSTDSQVATVGSDGRVTAVSAGECDIVASCIDKHAVCHVTVIDPIVVTLDQTSVTIEQTQQVTLTATISPEGATGQNVSWSTTNASVATVNGGVVTGVGVGECDIIASYLNKHAMCHVTVVATTIYITLDKHEAKLLPNHALTITPTVTPLSTSLKVTVSNPNVAAARLAAGNVQVVGLTEGTTMVVVSSTDGQAIPDACMVTVYTERGDVNCDGYINIADVTCLIDHLLGGEVASFKAENADANSDNTVNIADVTTLIDYLLGGLDINPPVTETFTVGGVSFTMMPVEGGIFTMGATPEQGDDANSLEKPAHQVTLSSYSIGQTEVTQALWLAVMGSNPSIFSSARGYTDNLQRPVECVSWYACQAFISKLNQMTGRTFRLPTEAEWEFAARGGNKSQGYKYAGSNNIGDVAWYYYNSWALGSSSPDYGTHTVATKSPNELGLYDMSGNVLEWCQDWDDNYSSAAQTNPTGPVSGSRRVHRGGSISDVAWGCRVSLRNSDDPEASDYVMGLRLAL